MKPRILKIIPFNMGLIIRTYIVLLVCAGNLNAIIQAPFVPNSPFKTTALINKLDTIGVTILTSHITCHGLNDGFAIAIGSGGTPPYTYEWSTNSFSADINNLSHGNYSVTVTDANSLTVVGHVSIIEPAELIVNINNGTLTCIDTIISINTNVNGGTVPFTFLWNTSDITSNVVVNATGQYSVKVTDANGCINSDTSTITQFIDPPAIEIFTPSSLGCLQTVVQISALADSDATYNWSTYNGHIISDYTKLSILVDKAGVYKLRVTSTLNGCISLDSMEVFGLDPVEASAEITNVNCFGDSTGKIEAMVTGGITPYRFIWSTGDTTSTISNLTAGTYTLIVRDDFSCKDTLNIVIKEPEKLNVIVSNTSLSGPGKQDGKASAISVGGTAPYNIKWSTGEVVQNIDSLGTGAYSITVTDALGCITTQSTYINPYNCTLNVNPIPKTVSCYGGADGSICSNIIGGTKPYSYIWNVTGTDSCLNNLAAGIYTVTVVDFAGCIEINQVKLDQNSEIFINSSDITITGETGKGFSDGTANIKASGGTPPYVYTFDNGTVNNGTDLKAGNHSITISDANNCIKIIQLKIPAYSCDSLGIKFANFLFTTTCINDPVKVCVNNIIGGVQPYNYLWGNGTTGICATDIISKINVVTITDAKNCPSKFFINNVSADTIAVKFDLVHTNPGMTDGSIIISFISGGLPPYTYLWSGPDAFSSTSKDLTGLSPGIYCLTITDANGCIQVNCVELKITVSTINLENKGWCLYPNPADNQITLRKTTHNSLKVNWSIFDSHGKLVKESNNQITKGAISIPIDQLIPGTYIIKLMENGINLVGKFIKK